MTKKFGEVFRELRLEKNILSKDAAEGVMSRAALSTFENKNVQISLDRFIGLLNNINVSVDEFLQRSQETDSWEKIVRTLDSAYAEGDIIGIKGVIHFTKKGYAHSKKEHYLFLKVVSQVMLKECGEDVQISRSELQRLENYLTYANHWGKYEFWLLENTLHLFGYRKVDFMVRSELTNLKRIKQLPQDTQIEAERCCIEVINFLLDKKQFSRAAYYVDELAIINSSNEFDFSFDIAYLTGKADFYHGKIDSDNLAIRTINYLRSIGKRHLANVYYKKLH